MAGIRGPLKKYAWKPLAIKEGVDEFGGGLWLDAGSSVMGSLDPVFDLLVKVVKGFLETLPI